jgi:glycosyltransferase involved in cell wall biosynthesis
MEKVLILTYYYPPCRGVSAYRPLSWAKDFHQHGYHPTIITRNWEGNENQWQDYLKENTAAIQTINSETHTTISLPYKKNKWLQFAEKKWVKQLYLNRLILMGSLLQGKFQSEIDGYTCFKEYLFNHLKAHSYKLIIVTSPPLNLIRLAYETQKKFNIPYAIDFQDSWNNLMLADNYRPSTKEKIVNTLQLFYLKKWLNNASFILSVTPAFNPFIKKISNTPIEVITNGFEKNAYSSTPPTNKNAIFNISLMGTVHPVQDIEMMLAGLNLFLKNKQTSDIQLNFIGIDAFPEMTKKINDALPAKFIFTSPRISMEEAVKQTQAADVLLFPSYKNFKGYYTAKIFEYLGARKNILMVPGDKDVVDELILETNAGKIANSTTEFATLLEAWYMEWKTTGTIQYHGINEKINFYSREHQNQLVCAAITNYIASFSDH